MEEQAERKEINFTYTYDQFSVFFHGDCVFVGEQERPVGQCCVDVINLDASVLDEIDRRVLAFIPDAEALLTEKTIHAARNAQEKLNAVWDIVFTLPVYRDLRMDEPCNYHAFERLLADKEKWAEVQDSASEGRAMYYGMVDGLTVFATGLRAFRQQMKAMAEQYFEPLPRRNSAAYAQAYSAFYADMVSVGTWMFQDDFAQKFPMEVSFVPMFQDKEATGIFIAEKATFYRLIDFLRTEFYRGLALGNAPRRCHNCGKYFLLTAGYNTCYCNNIAPGETERTCRKVGAHRKEAQGKANRTPAQVEYDRTYNRLKQRKNRRKISVDEWNTAVARAQDLLERSGRGEISDEELKLELNKL